MPLTSAVSLLAPASIISRPATVLAMKTPDGHREEREDEHLERDPDDRGVAPRHRVLADADDPAVGGIGDHAEDDRARPRAS